MGTRSSNKNLHKASQAKKDEFYTQLSDIEKELGHYKNHFKNKVVLCNCDDPRVSNFFHYFSYNFENLGLKKLITTCYKNQQPDLFSRNDSEKAIYLEYSGDKNNNKVPDPEEIGIKHLQGNGDFRSEECIGLLKQVDIVVTNPPFSLFREYVAQLIKYKKKFIIIGHQNAITYKEIFKLIKENKLWMGYGFDGVAAHIINTHIELEVGGTAMSVYNIYDLPDDEFGMIFIPMMTDIYIRLKEQGAELEKVSIDSEGAKIKGKIVYSREELEDMLKRKTRRLVYGEYWYIVNVDSVD